MSETVPGGGLGRLYGCGAAAVCVHVCVHACTCACACVCVCVCAFVRVCLNKDTSAMAVLIH